MEFCGFLIDLLFSTFQVLVVSGGIIPCIDQRSVSYGSGTWTARTAAVTGYAVIADTVNRKYRVIQNVGKGSLDDSELFYLGDCYTEAGIALILLSSY